MDDKDDRELFERALDNIPADAIRAKYGGEPPPPSKRHERHPDNLAEIVLDMHGKTRHEALALLRRTLVREKGRGRRLLVVTGKGTHSEDGRPVIRDAIVSWLETAGARYIRESRFAQPERGGDGAIEIVTR